MRRNRLAILSTLLGLTFLAAAIVRLDLRAVTAVLAAVNAWPWLFLGVASYLLGHRLRGIRLRHLVSREATLSTGTATNVVVVGYAVNNLLPARLGEVARAWMLMEKSGLSFVQTFTVTAVERVLDAVALLVWFGVATMLLPIGTGQRFAGHLIFGLVALGSLVLAIGVTLPGPVLAAASRLAHRWIPHAQDAVLSQVHAVLNGLAALRHPGTALAVLILTLAVWLCEAGLYLALLPAFALTAQPTHALFAMTATNLGILLPSTPGFVGTFHFFCSEALVAVGVNPAVAFGYAVIVHAAFFLPITLWGLVVLTSHGLSVARTLSLSRSGQVLSSGVSLALRPLAPASEAIPSKFLRSLAAVAVPLEADTMPSLERERAIDQTAAFVQGQMRELPMRLRAAFAVGLLVFRAATRLRYGRGFCELALARRRVWFEQWAYGRWGLGRQLFRAVRSTALLAWYEQPAARTALDAQSARAAKVAL